MLLGRGRLLVSTAVVALVFGGALAAAGACLPGLDAPPDLDAGPDAPSGPVLACGDGVIDPDAGEECDPGPSPVPGCAACKVTCEDGGTIDRDAGTQHCYFAAGFKNRYHDAVSACQQAAGHLVTLGSPSEVAIADGLAAGVGYWVGLLKDSADVGYVTTSAGVPQGFEPGWPYPGTSGPCPGCFGLGLDGGGFDAFSATGVDAGECVAALSGEPWGSLPCVVGDTPQLLAICEREPPGIHGYTCGQDICFTIASTTSTYATGDNVVTLADAVLDCQSHGDGWGLAVLDSPEERADLARELASRFGLDPTKQPTLAFWVGLALDPEAGAWTWSANGDPNAANLPQPWGNAQPDPAATPSGAGQAFLSFDTSDYASALLEAADSTEPTTPRYFVCERR